MRRAHHPGRISRLALAACIGCLGEQGNCLDRASHHARRLRCPWHWRTSECRVWQAYSGISNIALIRLAFAETTYSPTAISSRVAPIRPAMIASRRVAVMPSRTPVAHVMPNSAAQAARPACNVTSRDGLAGASPRSGSVRSVAPATQAVHWPATARYGALGRNSVGRLHTETDAARFRRAPASERHRPGSPSPVRSFRGRWARRPSSSLVPSDSRGLAMVQYVTRNLPVCRRIGQSLGASPP